MGAFTHIETDTGTNVDISAATAVGAYTSTGDKLIMVDVSIDAVAGNGDYVMYVTRQIGGSGSAYRILPQTTMTAASGLTAISGQSGWITVRNGDVLTCYVDGLAGDTATPDWSTRWFELAGVTAGAVADAVWEEAIADHTTSTTFGGKNQKVVPSETVGDYKADVSGIPAAVWGYATRTLSSFGSLIADIWSHATRTLSSFGFTVATNSDANVTAIKAKTDNLPANTTTTLAAIQSDLDSPAQYKADVSGLATTAHVQEVENKIDAIDITVNTIPTTPLLAANYTDPDNASIAAILEDTGTTIPATLAGLATSAEVGAITMLDEVVVGSYTMQDILKILAAKMVGKATGGGTTTIKYSGVDDTTDVVVETVDSNGNRSAVTLTV